MIVKYSAIKECDCYINAASCECMAFRMANRRGMMYWLIFLLPVAAATGGVSLEGKHLRVTTSRVISLLYPKHFYFPRLILITELKLYTVMDYVYDSNGNLTGYNGNGYALLSWLSEALKFSWVYLFPFNFWPWLIARLQVRILSYLSRYNEWWKS